MKVQRYQMVDAESGPGWGVVLLEDTQRQCFVVAWDGPQEEGTEQSTTLVGAKLSFLAAKRKVAA